MSKEEVLSAFEALSAADQQAVRSELAEHAASSCCSPDEMQEHMAVIMKMMGSSEKPMENCQQMMAMCEQMMRRMSAPA